MSRCNGSIWQDASRYARSQPHGSRSTRLAALAPHTFIYPSLGPSTGRTLGEPATDVVTLDGY